MGRPQRGGDDWQWTSDLGLIDLMVLIAGVVLLFTARYPEVHLRLRHGDEPLGPSRRLPTRRS